MNIRNLRAQVSTEYLIILAVVLVIALVVVFLVTQQAGTAAGATESQSRAYWASAAPFALSTYKASGTTLELSMENRDLSQLTLTSMSGNGITTTSFNQPFAGGEKRTVSVTLASACTTGSRFQFDNVTIVYSKDSITGIRQIGSTPLVGRCS